MKSGLAALGLILTVAGVARADFNPIPLTPGSFTADVVVENTAPPPLPNFATVTIDGGTNLNGNTFYEAGYVSYFPATGLPVAGSTIFALSNATYSFQMPATYAGNNCLFISTQVGYTTGALTLGAPPVGTTMLSILYTGGGSNLVDYVIHYQGGGTQPGQFGGIDWFNTTLPNVAYIAGGRVNLDNGSVNTINSTTQTKLFFTDPIFLTDTVNPVTSIDFSYNTGGSRTFVFGVSASLNGVDFSPVAVSGFNKDAVIDATAPRTGFYQSATTFTMDGGPNNTGNTWYERGLNRGTPTSGLPVAGSLLTNAALTRIFRMPATYVGNNSLCIGNYPGYTTGSLTLTSPQVLTGLSLLASAGGGSITAMGYSVHHQDSSVTTGTTTIVDWFNAASAVMTANGRFSVDTVAFNSVGTTTGTKIYNNDIAIANPSPVTSIDFTYPGTGGRGAIFALSGQTNSSGLYFPLEITGFNADTVVEASVALPRPPFPNPLATATTVSMDGGTNNTGNTWFEQGYFTGMPLIGLPAAGSTLNSAYLPDHHYTMPPTYAGNNAIFVDSSHPVANLTPATPAWYSGLSILSATANGNVTNQCIIQYSDGTADTNTFVSVDWFNNNPYAFSPLGRVSLDTRTINNDPGHVGTANPRLYEAQFALKGATDLGNTSYQVTNILLTYVGAPSGAAARMVALAVSGNTGPMAPVIRSQPAGFTTIEGSNVVLSVALGGGSPPFANVWQVGTNNVWATVVNGANISGADTLSLTFTSIGWTNTADYRFISSGPGGASTSAVARITVLSGLPDVTQPTDPIAILSGSTPAAEVVGNAINNNTTKWLNFDADAVAPFVGPVGCIVSPAIGKTTLSLLRFYTANDGTERDPAAYQLEGSNDGGTTWTLISSNALNLSTTRNAAALALNPLTLAMQEVRFANTIGYNSYKLSFNNVRTPASANSMQIGEIEFLGVPTPTPPFITLNPTPNMKVYVGASPTFNVVAIGYPTNFTYQWYLNGTTPIPGATNKSYTLSNAQLSDSGKTFSCTVVNSQGSTSSTVSTLTVVAAPTTSYAMKIMADQPMGFWRLDEPEDGLGNNGAIATDYWGGHNGAYSNVVLGVTGYPAVPADPNTAASFNGYADSYAGGIQGIDFGAPSNSASAFSVEAWINGGAQLYDAGIVSKGSGGGGEQFTIDTGGTAAGAHGIRFYVRDASGAVHSANTGTNQLDGIWHHVVGVCDQANSNVTLYVDGRVSSVAAILPTQGLLSSSWPVSIGSRTAGVVGSYSNAFYGTIDEVAIYSYALSSNQVLNHYYAAGIAPTFVIQPTNATVAEGATAKFVAVAYGSPTLAYQWYRSIDGGVNFSPLPGQTSATLTIPNVQPAINGYVYHLVATSGYGTATSADATLAVVSGPPQILSDLVTPQLFYAGGTLTLSVEVGGTAPFTYQWQRNGLNVSNGGRISGATTNVLRIANVQAADGGSYQLLINNSQGSAQSIAAEVTVINVATFNTNGLGWGLNGNPNVATVVDNVIHLTTGSGSSARSAFFQFPVYVGAFQASFTYQNVSGVGGADGASFCLHNDPRGATALGGTGGALGVSGITPSAELEFNIYPNNVPGISFMVNGATGGYQATPPISIDSGDPVGVAIRYSGGTMSITLTNQAGASYSTSLSANLPDSVEADTAYVGFTGADGGTVSTQLVKDFKFVPLPTLTAQPAGPNTLLLTWPTAIGGYELQATADLGSGIWQPIPVSISGQVLVQTTGQMFFRLALIGN